MRLTCAISLTIYNDVSMFLFIF